MSTLTATSLDVTLGSHRALRDVNARFDRGRVTALLGPNGAGKSTLLACLAGLRSPDRGQIALDAVAMSRIARRERARRIGFLPQSPDVHWDIDVATLVALGRLPHRGRCSRDEDTAAVQRAMEATNTAQFATRSARQLSGGERARVLFARVLAGEPDWLLADEPLANLDPPHQLDVLHLMRSVAARGTGIVLVLHDLSHAARIADDILLMRGGRIIKHGRRDEVIGTAPLRETFGIEVHIGAADGAGRFVIPLRRSG